MSLKITILAVVTASVLGFSGGFFVKTKIADAEMAGFKKQLTEEAVRIKSQADERRAEYEKRIAKAIAERDEAVADLEESRAEFSDNLERLRSNANAAIAAARRANASPVAPGACERQLRDLRNLAKKSAALHFRCSKILDGVVTDFGKTIQNQRAISKAVAQ